MPEPNPRFAPDPPFFSESQRRMVAAALTCTAFSVIVALVVGCIYLFGAVVSRFAGVLWPLAVAGILALMLRPIVELIERRLKGRRMGAVLIVGVMLLLLFSGFLLLIVPPAVEQVLAFFAFVPVLWADASEYLRLHYPQWAEMIERQLENPTIKSIVEQATQEMQTLFKHAVPSLKAAGSGLVDIAAFVTHLAIVPIYLFFFLLSRGHPTAQLGEHLPFLRPSLRNDVVFLVSEFISIVVSFFRGQLLIGLIMGILYSVGFSLAGLKFGAVVGMMLGFLNVVPYLGSIIGLLLAVPLALFQPDGGWRLVALILLVKLIVQNVEGWILTPKIMSDRTGLHPVMVIVAVFFWGTALNGLAGMVLAIPLTAFFVTVWRLARKKYTHGFHPRSRGRY